MNKNNHILQVFFAIACFSLLLQTSFLSADTFPSAGLVNFETPHVHPIDLTPDQNTLLAVNTAANRLEIYTLNGVTMTHKGFVPVGFDPVSVRARNNNEAWVVNHISDSISVVDLDAMTVTATLETDNEPADVVFAGSPVRAFVSCSEANSINVFNPNNLQATPSRIAITGEDPRALAVSTDGNTVYAAIFESGNATTVLAGGESVIADNAVSRPEGPYAGTNPPPNNGSNFSPAINPAIGTPPQTALIVRKDNTGDWMDDNNGDWSLFVSGSLASVTTRTNGWDLPDNDVAIINANTLGISYQKRLMNMVMALAVNPATNRVSTIGTDATNEIRFEPILNGTFVRVNHASFSANGGTTQIDDLNPHLDYTQATEPASVRNLSLGDPRGIAWNSNGSRAVITGMGSDNVVIINAAGNRISQLAVGEGPTGVVIDDSANRAFVMNKFSGSVSVINLNSLNVDSELAFFDPTSAAVKQGRKFLYNTHLTSGPGHLSCGSCHVDGRTDRLAWDLGDPSGTLAQVPDANNNTGQSSGNFNTVSPMKGPMLTQTLQDIMAHPRLHWRGDREELSDFNATFVNLMGAPGQISAADMTAFSNFLGTIHLPPNPYRNIDNTRPATVTLPDGNTATTSSFQSLRGQNSRNNNCLRCHLNNGTRNGFANSELRQAFTAPALTAFYDRLGYWPDLANGSTNGFGFFHDGADRLGGAVRSETAEFQDDMLAEIMTLEGPEGPLTGNEIRQDVHAGVGRQVTINGTATSQQTASLNQLMSIAASNQHAAIIAKGRINNVQRGYAGNGGSFQSDRASEQRSLAELLNLAAAGNPVTFTLVPEGTQQRYGIDINGNGVFDGDENNPPVLTLPAEQTNQVGDSINLSITASDSDNDTLSYNASGLPQGLNMNTTTAVISGILTTAGNFNVTITVSDGLGSDSGSFNWVVDPEDPGSSLEAVITSPAANASLTVPVTITGTAAAPDGVGRVLVGIRDQGSNLWWNNGGWGNWVLNPATLANQTTSTADWSLTFNPAGTSGSGQYRVFARTEDSNGTLSPATAVNFTASENIDPGVELAVSISAPAANTSVDAPVTIAGSATSPTGVSEVVVAIRDQVTNQWWNNGSWGSWVFNPAVVTASGVSQADWNFVFDPNGSNGSGQYRVFVRSRNASGNQSPSVAHNFSVNSESGIELAAVIDNPVANSTTEAPAIINGTATAPDGVAQVLVAIRDQVNNLWWNNGSWGSWVLNQASLNQTSSTSANWSFAFNPVNSGGSGEYRVFVRTEASNGARSPSVATNFSLTDPVVDPQAFADDFESALGWITNPSGTDTATTGNWERANPEETSSGGTIMQPNSTVSGSFALVTAATAGTSVGSNDVDGGVTSIQSPLITLPITGSHTLSLNYYFSHLNNASNSDFFSISVVAPSGTQTLLDIRGEASNRSASWIAFTADLSAYAGSNIRLLIEAADADTASLIEAGVDDVMISSE